MRRKDDDLGFEEPQEFEELDLDQLEQANGGFFDLLGMLGGLFGGMGGMMGGMGGLGSLFGGMGGGGGMPDFNDQLSPSEQRLYNALAAKLEKETNDPLWARR